MTTRPDYLRYLESATQAEFEERLRSEGYSVQAEESHGGVQFDLVARKGAKSVAYEFKAGRSPKSGRESIERLQRAANEAGFEFHIVVVNPPPRVSIEIENLASQLREHMNESFPDELESLSTHTSISGVCDLDISDIRVGKGEIRVAGVGTVDVELQYGSGSDEDPASGNAFPFRFKAVLSANGELSRVEELKVDTSSFYE
jgi:hypothetical protein